MGGRCIEHQDRSMWTYGTHLRDNHNRLRSQPDWEPQVVAWPRRWAHPHRVELGPVQPARAARVVPARDDRRGVGHLPHRAADGRHRPGRGDPRRRRDPLPATQTTAVGGTYRSAAALSSTALIAVLAAMTPVVTAEVSSR